MNFLRNTNIGVRLGMGFGCLLILLICVAAVGIHGLKRANDSLRHIVENNVQKIALIDEMSTSIHIVARVVRTIALVTDEAEAKRQHEKIDVAREMFDTAYAKLSRMPLNDEGKGLMARIKEQITVARAANNRFADLYKTNKADGLIILLNEAIPTTTKLQETLEEFSNLQKLNNKKDEEVAAESYEDAFVIMLVLSAGALCSGGLIAWSCTRSITRPMANAVSIARTVAGGDLTSEIHINSTDETGQLILALKEMNDSLLDIVKDVRSGSETISTASQQIANGNLDLSSRTEQQASSLEETASAMEELTTTVKLNTENAMHANQLAISASGTAVRGGEVVAEVVRTMGSIDESSKKIVEIISVIDSIAFQTNILALNAAVEAARAGEQGRGFAVVASEVRNLAQRSAAAAKEIKILIDDSVAKVSAGTHLVDQAGTTMLEVVKSIKNVTDMMKDIAVASQEQSSGIEQINLAIAQMDEVTQQNAALVEESAAAADSLQGEAGRLTRRVNVFKVEVEMGVHSHVLEREMPGRHDRLLLA